MWHKTDNLTSLCFSFLIQNLEFIHWLNPYHVLNTVLRSGNIIIKNMFGPNPQEDYITWCWNWSSSTLATWYEELTHWKRPWCWERLKAGGEGDNRGWDGCVASPIQWTCFEQAPGVGDGQGGLDAAVHGVAKSRTQLSDWTATILILHCWRKF